MEKGLLIFLIVFICIVILNFFIIWITKLSEDKKQKTKKFFWYIYGILFITSGVVNLIENKEFSFIFISQVLLGIIVLILNYMGKIKTKTP